MWCGYDFTSSLVIPPASMKLKRGYTGITLSVCPPADDILLDEFCYYNPMDLLHHLERRIVTITIPYYKSLQYHIKTLQEEFAKKSNIPWIWRIIYGHRLPYMKKTRKKKQVCGAACFLAAEIKFSKDVRLSVCGQNRVCSVSSTILIRSISYLHILSSNFRMCVTCNACFKIKKIEILVNFLNL